MGLLEFTHKILYYPKSLHTGDITCIKPLLNNVPSNILTNPWESAQPLD
jgi:hypothetical protein